MNFSIKIPSICIKTLFYASIPIDLLNGYLQLGKGIQSPIGQVFRIILIGMLLFSLYPYKCNYLTKYVILWFVIWLSCFCVWTINAAQSKINFSFFIEINDMIRILYFWLCILFFLKFKCYFKTYKLLKTITKYGLIISLCIICSFITGFGHNSYGEDYGFGTRSWFIAGNDLGITLIFCLITSTIVLIQNISLINCLYFILIFVGCVLIGSRVGIIGSILILLYLSAYYLFFYKPSKTNKRSYIISIIFIIPIFSYYLYLFAEFIYSTFDSYTIERLSLEGIGAARQSLSIYATQYIDTLSGLSILIGRGVSAMYSYISAIGGYYADYTPTEKDVHDTIGSFGFIFGIYTLIPFIYWLIKSFKLYIRIFSFTVSSIFLICLLFIVIGILSGHCIKNAMVAPIYAFYISLLYKIYENTNYFKYVSE